MKKKLVFNTKLTLSTTHMRKGKKEYMKEVKIFKEHGPFFGILFVLHTVQCSNINLHKIFLIAPTSVRHVTFIRYNTHH